MKHRAYKFRFYPTESQATLLAQTFGCVRFVYNSILRWRSDEYYQSRAKIGYIQASAKLTEFKNNLNLLFWMTYLAFPHNKPLDTNKRLLRTFLRVVRNIQHSKRKLINNRRNVLKVPLSTKAAVSILLKVKSHLILNGLGNCQASLALLLFPKIAQDVTLYRACASLKIRSCQSLIPVLVLMLVLPICLCRIASR